MRLRGRSEMGETLVEIVLAVVIIGIVVSALFASIATNAASSKTHRDLVTADGLLRDYAEATKLAARVDCPTNTTFTTTTVPGPLVSSDTSNCPANVTSVQPVVLTLTLPNGTQRTLSIDVRTP